MQKLETFKTNPRPSELFKTSLSLRIPDELLETNLFQVKQHKVWILSAFNNSKQKLKM